MIEYSSFLEWDSNLFGFDVGIIRVGQADDGQIKEEIKHIQRIGCKLIYVCSPRLLNLKEFKVILADKKRSYVLKQPKFVQAPVQVYSSFDNPSLLYDLAYQAGQYSRFKVDPNIGEDNFKKLYRRWIDNSFKAGYADYVLVPTHDNKPMGIITAKRKGNELSIGLFATDKNYRERGIGSSLIQEVINEAALKGLSVEVTTQADNEKACKFYEHRGFEIAKEEFVYHVWQ